MRLAELHALLDHATPIRRDRFRAKCPAHDGQSQSLSVSLGDTASIVVKCFAGCAAEEIVAALGLTLRDLFDGPMPDTAAPRAPRPTAPRQQPTVQDWRRERAVAIWNSSTPIRALGLEYLRARGCVIPPDDSDLRYHPGVDLFGFSGPALVGRISDATDASRGLGLHITWLAADGTLRRLERRYLGAKASGVVRLWPDADVSTALGVAEGVETALSLAHTHQPVWACLDAGNLAMFPVLGGIEALTIGADRDESGTGQEAAAECAERWLAAGREARILMPDRVGADLNDEVRNAGR